jgi:hypothetical protein
MKKILDIIFGKRVKPSRLALSIWRFTNESHFEQIHRQGRIWEYQANK